MWQPASKAPSATMPESSWIFSTCGWTTRFCFWSSSVPQKYRRHFSKKSSSMEAEPSTLPGGASKSLSSRRHTSHIISHLAVVALGSVARLLSNMCTGSPAFFQISRYSSTRPPSAAAAISWNSCAQQTIQSPGKLASRPWFSSSALPWHAQNSASAVPLMRAHIGVGVDVACAARRAISSQRPLFSCTA